MRIILLSFRLSIAQLHAIQERKKKDYRKFKFCDVAMLRKAQFQQQHKDLDKASRHDNVIAK